MDGEEEIWEEEEESYEEEIDDDEPYRDYEDEQDPPPPPMPFDENDNDEGPPPPAPPAREDDEFDDYYDEDEVEFVEEGVDPPPPPQMIEEEVLKEGWLFKCGSHHRVWQSRWSVLTHHNLICFSGKDLSEESSRLNLTKASLNFGKGKLKKPKTEFVFQIKEEESGRNFFFCAPSEPVLGEWCEAILKALNMDEELPAPAEPHEPLSELPVESDDDFFHPLDEDVSMLGDPEEEEEEVVGDEEEEKKEKPPKKRAAKKKTKPKYAPKQEAIQEVDENSEEGDEDISAMMKKPLQLERMRKPKKPEPEEKEEEEEPPIEFTEDDKKGLAIFGKFVKKKVAAKRAAAVVEEQPEVVKEEEEPPIEFTEDDKKGLAIFGKFVKKKVAAKRAAAVVEEPKEEEESDPVVELCVKCHMNNRTYKVIEKVDKFMELTVRRVKNKLRGQTKLAVEQLEISYLGAALQDDWKLVDLDLNDDSVLDLHRKGIPVYSTEDVGISDIISVASLQSQAKMSFEKPGDLDNSGIISLRQQLRRIYFTLPADRNGAVALGKFRGGLSDNPEVLAAVKRVSPLWEILGDADADDENILEWQQVLGILRDLQSKAKAAPASTAAKKTTVAPASTEAAPSTAPPKKSNVLDRFRKAAWAVRATRRWKKAISPSAIVNAAMAQAKVDAKKGAPDPATRKQLSPEAAVQQQPEVAPEASYHPTMETPRAPLGADQRKPSFAQQFSSSAGNKFRTAAWSVAATKFLSGLVAKERAGGVLSPTAPPPAVSPAKQVTQQQQPVFLESPKTPKPVAAPVIVSTPIADHEKENVALAIELESGEQAELIVKPDVDAESQARDFVKTHDLAEEAVEIIAKEVTVMLPSAYKEEVRSLRRQLSQSSMVQASPNISRETELLEELHRAKEELEEKKKVISTLEESLKQASDERGAEVGSIRSQFSSLSEQLEENRKTLRTAEQSLREREQYALQKETEVRQLRAKLDASRVRASELEDLYEEKQEEESAARQALEAFTGEVSFVNQELEACKAELKESLQHLSTATDELVACRQTLADSDMDIAPPDAPLEPGMVIASVLSVLEEVDRLRREQDSKRVRIEKLEQDLAKSKKAPNSPFGIHIRTETSAGGTVTDAVARKEWREWMNEKQLLISQHNTDVERMLSEIRRLREALTPSATQTMKRLETNDKNQKAMKMELNDAIGEQLRLKEELKTVYQQWEEEVSNLRQELEVEREQAAIGMSTGSVVAVMPKPNTPPPPHSLAELEELRAVTEQMQQEQMLMQRHWGEEVESMVCVWKADRNDLTASIERLKAELKSAKRLAQQVEDTVMAAAEQRLREETTRAKTDIARLSARINAMEIAAKEKDNALDALKTNTQHLEAVVASQRKQLHSLPVPSSASPKVVRQPEPSPTHAAINPLRKVILQQHSNSPTHTSLASVLDEETRRIADRLFGSPRQRSVMPTALALPKRKPPPTPQGRFYQR